MPHAHHFLSRLDRVSLPHVELALGLYRDEALLRYILDRARPPEGAGRVALSLDHPERGPFLVVTRDGHFVTCLGEGMTPGDLPVITRGQLDAIAAHREELRARMAAARQLAGGGDVRRLLHRIYDAGDALSREEFVAVSALQPLYALEFLRLALTAADEVRKARLILVPELRKSDRLHPEYKEGLRSYWQTQWAIGHFLVLAAMDGARPEVIPPKILEVLEGRGFSWAAVAEARMPLAPQGAWAVGRMGKPLLGLEKRLLRDSYDALTAIDSTLGLCALGLRHARLRAEIQKELASPLQPGLDESSPRGKGIREIRKLALQVLEFDETRPEEVAQTHRRFGASTWMELTRRLPPGAPLRYERQEDVPEDLALTMAVNVNYNIVQAHDTVLWLFSLLAWTTRAAPEQLYLPRAALRAIREPWQAEHTLEVLRAHRDMTPRRAPPRPEGPARKGPCPCGSGKKYKRCCGEAAEV